MFFGIFLAGRNQPSGATLKIHPQPSSVLRDISIRDGIVSVPDCSPMYENVDNENDSGSKGDLACRNSKKEKQPAT